MLDQSKVALGISPEGRPVPIQLTAAGLLAVSGGSGGAGNGAFVDGYVLIGIAPDGTRVPISVDSSGVIQTGGGSGGGSGTVTSVAMTVPSILAVSGSPIVGAGTLAITLATQSANVVFAGPVSGGAATPTFRTLVTADLGTSLAVQHASLSLGGTLPTGALFAIPIAAIASSNYGEVSLGGGPFDGTTSGFFVGNSNGTHIAINAASGYLGRMIDAQIAGVRMFGVGRGSQASSTSATLNAIDFPAFTVTITGNTAITTAAGFNYTTFGQPTYSAASAVTITNSATVVIVGAPVGAGTGPATLTNSYALWVQSGITKFDGREINTFAGAASAPALTLSGAPFAGTGTTSFPLLYVNDSAATASTTLSTAGTYLGVNGHGTANLLWLGLDGVSRFAVSSAGQLQLTIGSSATPSIVGIGQTTVGIYFPGTSEVAFVGGNLPLFNFYVGAGPSFGLASTASLVWTNTTNTHTGTADIFIQRLAAASLQLGAAANATPVSYLLTVGESAIGGTTNNGVGGGATIRTGLGTGTGATGPMLLQTAVLKASGTTIQTYATALTLDNLQNVAFGAVGILKSYVVSALPAAIAGGLAFVTDAVATAITGLGLAVTGGGSNKVVVYSDGSSWLVL